MWGLGKDSPGIASGLFSIRKARVEIIRASFFVAGAVEPYFGRSQNRTTRDAGKERRRISLLEHLPQAMPKRTMPHKFTGPAIIGGVGHRQHADNRCKCATASIFPRLRRCLIVMAHDAQAGVKLPCIGLCCSGAGMSPLSRELTPLTPHWSLGPGGNPIAKTQW